MTSAAADILMHIAVEAVRDEKICFQQVLEQLQVPIYVTDPEGVVRYYNQACVGFAGRCPEIGRDRWCVTWKLYTEAGDYLPHELCPMAIAVKEKRLVRGVIALAERPDGSRLRFTPYPTPLLAEDGTLTGAINMFIDPAWLADQVVPASTAASLH